MSLELYDNVLDVPANVHFPCLKILSLRVVFANDDSLSRLLSSCPILEDFTVERVRHYDVLVLDISVTSLKGITVKRPSFRYARCNIEYKLLINAPLLERIELKDENCRGFLEEDFPNLVEATIEASSLYRAFLECSDNLKTFVFHIIPTYHKGRKCGRSLPESVPKGVLLSLKTLKMTGFYNNECDWRLVRYISKNAKVLKQMKIGISFHLKKWHHLLRNLLMYPRA
ncbi:hypothetical protein REPUB_Repub01dG0228900 [Reevesia pubescens]